MPNLLLALHYIALPRTTKRVFASDCNATCEIMCVFTQEMFECVMGITRASSRPRTTTSCMGKMYLTRSVAVSVIVGLPWS